MPTHPISCISIEHIAIEIVDQLAVTQPAESIGVLLGGPKGRNDRAEIAPLRVQAGAPVLKPSKLPTTGIIADIGFMDPKLCRVTATTPVAAARTAAATRTTTAIRTAAATCTAAATRIHREWRRILGKVQVVVCVINRQYRVTEGEVHSPVLTIGVILRTGNIPEMRDFVDNGSRLRVDTQPRSRPE